MGDPVFRDRQRIEINITRIQDGRKEVKKEENKRGKKEIRKDKNEGRKEEGMERR